MIRGEIWQVESETLDRSDKSFSHPVLIVQDNSFNDSNIKTILVLPITTNLYLANAPGNILIKKHESRLKADSVIIASQIYAIDRRRFKERRTKINNLVMHKVEIGMKLALGINT
jgi:mRNA interferase MazF